jgi:hypothetical protein
MSTDPATVDYLQSFVEQNGNLMVVCKLVVSILTQNTSFIFNDGFNERWASCANI